MYKKNKEILLIIIALLTIVVGCSDEPMVDNVVLSNKEALVNLKFFLPEKESVVVSRSQEERVSDIYLLICDINGNIEERYYFDQAGTVNGATMRYNDDIHDKGFIANISTTYGTHRIFGIANSKNGSAFDIKSQIDATTNILSFVAEMSNRTIARGDNAFLMAGEYCENSSGIEASVNISSDVENLNGFIKLRRIDSQINFKITNGAVNGLPANSPATFTPLSWQVINVPVKSFLIEKNFTETGNHDASGNTASNYFNSDVSTTFSQEGEFKFYMTENRKQALGMPEKYGDRAKFIKDTNEQNTSSFVYSPAYATYVIIKGKYVGYSKIDGAYKYVSAEVSYRVFLGNTNDALDSYSTNRNYKYFYNVTVKGINDIYVEVKTHNEDRPDVEGEVMIAEGGDISVVDAHYSAITLTFKSNDIKNQNDDFFTYYVYTPFHTSIIDNNGKLEAASWVKFVRNRRNSSNKYLTNFESYTLAYDKTNNIIFPYESFAAVNKLQNVEELLNELKHNKNSKDNSFFDRDGKVVYTAFIDENYYPDKDWKQFVNCDSRKLMILANTTQSLDKKSSVTEASHVIEQKSIQTFYNTSAESLTKAYGIEIIEENVNQVSDHVDDDKTKYHGTDLFNGLNNTRLSALIGKKWSDNIDYTTGKIKANYSYLVPLQRNRDLDGDNIIDSDEIIWYLPTLYQYQAMYIGLYGISPESRLYYNESNWFYKHYISSNNADNSNYGQIMWAEEGCSFGSSDNSFTDKSHFYVRCVRNLGTTDGTYQDYITYTPASADNNAIIELSYLNNNSLRKIPYQKEVGMPCYTFDENNKPYQKIEIARRNIVPTTKVRNEFTYKWVDEEELANTGEGSCNKMLGNGWRMPTTTEIALIIQKMGEASLLPNYNNITSEEYQKPLILRTRFQYSDQASTISGGSKQGRYGYMYSGIIYLINGHSYDAFKPNDQGVIRCVKDIK